MTQVEKMSDPFDIFMEQIPRILQEISRPSLPVKFLTVVAPIDSREFCPIAALYNEERWLKWAMY